MMAARSASTSRMPAPPDSRHAFAWTPYLCLAASMALVGAYVGFSKLLVGVFPLFLLMLLRFGIAAVAMLPWQRRAEGEATLSRRDRWLLFLESFFGNFLFSLCMLWGVSLTTALAAGVIMAALPGVVALLSRVFLGERIAPRVLAGLVCAVSGIALVSFSRHADSAAAGAGSLLGNLMLFGAVTCEATYVVIGKKLAAQISAKRISAQINLWGLVLVAPLGLWQARGFDFAAVAAVSWLQLVFYAIAASVVTVWLWMTGLKHVQASSAGVFTVLLPVSAAAVGVVFLGEQISGLQAAAFALALVGVVMSTWPARQAGPGLAAA
jgi:drug/metabolite transporter (DMT)-like permease